MPKRLKLADHIFVPKPDDGAVLRYSQDAVDDVFNFFSLLVFGQNEWAGKPFLLQPWQEQLIREFYGVQVQDEDGSWVRYRRFLYNEIAKKNGKSELAAALGLYHLLFDGEQRPQVAIFAADKSNADIIYQAAKYMVEHTCLGEPQHDPIAWARDSRREIHTKFGGLLKVYSADIANKHGYSFSCIIIDELHAQPNRKLWDVLTVGSDSARRQQAVIVLTTAGNDPDRTSIGWEIHEKCRRILAWRNGTPERELDEDDPSWCPIMYGISTLTQDDPEKIEALDIYDEKIWKACNPSYGVTISPRKFRADARTAKQSEASERNFRWLRLNQWVSTKTVGWIPLSLYDKTQWNMPEFQGLNVKERRVVARDLLTGKRCYGGLDLSKSTDLTAFVLLFPPQEDLETWVTLFWGWVPLDDIENREVRDGVPYRDWIRANFLVGCDGDIIDYDAVCDVIEWADSQFDLRLLGLDPHMSWTLSQRLMGHGIEVAQVSQTMMGMSPATKKLEMLLRKRELLHEHNTAARWCFGNVRCATDGNENLKPMKNQSKGRIDIAVAWIIAMAAAMGAEAKKPTLMDRLESGEFSF